MDALKFFFFLAVMASVIFGAAGRFDLPFAWALIGIYGTFALIGMSRVDPGLRRERFQPGPGGIDRHMRLLMLPFIFLHWVVAGLDLGRFHWSGAIPLWLQIIGLIIFAMAMGWACWAMITNPFFSPVVRIQTERGHHLITSGPYRFIRHPGYLGAILASLSSPIALGSWVSALPNLAICFNFLRRTALEDQFLQKELDGYLDYASRVRWRLLPRLW